MSTPTGMPAAPNAASVSADSPSAADVFALVPVPLRSGLIRRGFTQLTPVQDAALAAMNLDRDLQITSQTGSGKTVALGFVMARLLLAKTPRGRGPSTIVIAPTRELAAQVKDELEWLFADTREVSLDCVTGGTSIGAERFRLARKPLIVVGTPGRLLDHITNGVLDVTGVTQLVLDEADQMLDMGFRDELDGILATMPTERRTHLVSATFPAQVLALTQRYQQEALHIAGTAHGEAHADIEHVVHPVGPRERYAALVNLLLLSGDERTLVFVRTRQDTTGLADKLAGDGFAALPISGDLAQAQRTRTLASFRRGTVTTLIATDVAARGLDIPNVTTVVHVDPPIDPETYTHRSGRTGRAGQKGRSVLLAPRVRERAIRRLLQLAKVQVQWLPVPDADVVRARQIDRLGDRVRGQLAETKPCASQRSLADRLLAENSPQDVVAGLLAAMSQEQTREPFAFGAQPMPAHAPKPLVQKTPPAVAHVGTPVSAPSATSTAQAHKVATAKPAMHKPAALKPAMHKQAVSQPAKLHEAAPTQASHKELGPKIALPRIALPKIAAAKPAAHKVITPVARTSATRVAPTHAEESADPATPLGRQPVARGRRGAAPAWQPQPPVEVMLPQSGYTRFRINWGRVHGAEAKRILAHVCRRADIESNRIGAISVQLHFSTFDVTADRAEEFARRVQPRDRRDPELIITREDLRRAGSGKREHQSDAGE